MAKCFEDAFRSIGILKDDSPEYVTRTIIECFKTNKRKGAKKVSFSGTKIDEEAEDYVEIIINLI